MKILAGLMGCAVGWLTDEIIFVRVPRAAVAIVVDDRIQSVFIVWATLGGWPAGWSDGWLTG